MLEPLYRLMCDRVRRSAALHTDDTPVALLAPRRTAHAWVYVGDAANPYTVFDLSVGRSRDAPAAFLKGYTGFVHADGYAGYNPVYEGGATHVGCWMHARRYFFDARLTDPERAHEALARIRALYAVEREAKEKESDRGRPRRVPAAARRPGPDRVRRLAGRAATAGAAEVHDRRSVHVRHEPVAHPRRVPDRRAADDRQRGRPSRPSARWPSVAGTGCTWAGTAG